MPTHPRLGTLTSAARLTIVLTLAVAAAAAACADSDARDDNARFCDSLTTLERALTDVDALDAGSSAREAASARDELQAAYHDLADGTVVLENGDDPPEIDIDPVAEDIEDLVEALTEVADGEPLGNQLALIDRLRADIAVESDRLAQAADCD